MIKELDGTKDHALAIEIIDGYTHEDEKSLEKMFEQRLDKGYQKVNLLVKLDHMSILKTSWRAAWEDGIYALKHMKYCGRIAVVGDSKVEEWLGKADNAVFGNEKTGRVERFFPLQELTTAFNWVNEKS